MLIVLRRGSAKLFLIIQFKFEEIMNVHGIDHTNNRLPAINRRNPARIHQENNEPGFMQNMGQPVVEEHLRIADTHKVLFISGRKNVKNPYNQNYWDMITSTLCPNFNFLSLTILLVLADIALFIFQISVGIQKQSGFLLKIKAQTMIKYGANYSPNVRNGQVYRLISAMFLHHYFMHLFSNVLTTFMFVSRIQYTFGAWKTLVIYIMSGITGNIFSLTCNQKNSLGVSAGASTALFGIIGVIVGYIIINWNGLDLVGPAMKCNIWCTTIMIIVFIFIFTPTSGSQGINLDYYGHLGGFIAGVLLASIHTTIIIERREIIIRITFAVLFLVLLLILFLVFYFR